MIAICYYIVEVYGSVFNIVKGLLIEYIINNFAVFANDENFC